MFFDEKNMRKKTKLQLKFERTLFPNVLKIDKEGPLTTKKED